MTKDTETESPLTARQDHEGFWTVEDARGGTWRPDWPTLDEIEDADEPAEAAVRICEDEPTRGTWHS